MRAVPHHIPETAPEEIRWTPEDRPVSTRYGDGYYAADGLSESRHVFLAGTGLPERFAPGFRIAEIGFGTGLNMLAALLEWRRAGMPGRLRYTGFEAHPLSAAATDRALAAFPEAYAAAGPLLAARAKGAHRIETDDLAAEIVVGDARETVPDWPGTAEAWFLDGFAPDRNPELWEPALLRAVAARTAPGGRLASYTAAGHVRRALAEAGLAVTRAPGFGRKRHMTRAEAPAPRPPHERHQMSPHP